MQPSSTSQGSGAAVGASAGGGGNGIAEGLAQMGGFGRGNSMSNPSQLVGNPDFMNMVNFLKRSLSEYSSKPCLLVDHVFKMLRKPFSLMVTVISLLTNTIVTFFALFL